VTKIRGIARAREDAQGPASPGAHAPDAATVCLSRRGWPGAGSETRNVPICSAGSNPAGRILRLFGETVVPLVAQVREPGGLVVEQRLGRLTHRVEEIERGVMSPGSCAGAPERYVSGCATTRRSGPPAT
jgi:hypothetical protein